MVTRATPLPRLGYVTLAWVTLGWGLNFPMMKIAMLEIPPFTFRAGSCFVAGLCLLLLARARGGRIWPEPQERGPLVAATLFNVVIWQMFIGYALLIMPSGQTSLIGFTMPVWAALIGWLCFGERITMRVVAALALGMGGIAVLVLRDPTALGTAPLGTLLILIGAIGWGLGTQIQKRTPWTISIFALAGWQILLSVVPVGALVPFVDGLALRPVTNAAWLASAYVVFIAIVTCYIAWFKTVSLFPATIASIGTLLAPVVGLVSGSIILDEPLGWREGAATLLIALALILVLYAPTASRAAPAAAD